MTRSGGGSEWRKGTGGELRDEIKLRYACLTSFLLGKGRKRPLLSLRASVATSGLAALLAMTRGMEVPKRQEESGCGCYQPALNPHQPYG